MGHQLEDGGRTKKLTEFPCLLLWTQAQTDNLPAVRSSCSPLFHAPAVNRTETRDKDKKKTTKQTSPINRTPLNIKLTKVLAHQRARSTHPPVSTEKHYRIAPRNLPAGCLAGSCAVLRGSLNPFVQGLMFTNGAKRGYLSEPFNVRPICRLCRLGRWRSGLMCLGTWLGMTPTSKSCEPGRAHANCAKVVAPDFSLWLFWREGGKSQRSMSRWASWPASWCKPDHAEK